ncbi:MAG: hypothetical protein EKK41_16705 [Hyphomicrobiales bacterium]|nr:MAG: hypothetical protein EKK41_16705 [Hyphomicrobiales bacterium]
MHFGSKIAVAIGLAGLGALMGLLATNVISPAARAATPIEAMAGYWSGTGSVSLTSGKTERVKCAVTYKVSDGGAQIKQNMRCASQDYTINSSADLRVHGNNVTGSWEEKTYSATGQVSGKYTGTAFNLSIKGGNFSAALNLNTSECKQQISITPQGLEVNRITIGLAKC